MVQKRLKTATDLLPERRPGDPQRSERRERRSPLSVLLCVCGFSVSGRIFSEMASTCNISRSGCCIRLRAQPLEHAALALQVIPREGPSPEGGAQLLYQVAWLRQHGEAWYVGLSALCDTDLLQVVFDLHTP